MKFLISIGAALISLATATQQSAGGMDAIQQMLQQIMGYYQQQQSPIMNNSQQPQMAQSQAGGMPLPQANTMNPQANTMNPQANTMNPQGNNMNSGMNSMNPQQQQLQQQMYQLPNAQPQIPTSMDPNQQMQQLPQQQLNDDNHQQLLRFMQGLNSLSQRLNNSTTSALATFPATPAVTPAVTDTQTIQPTTRKRFSDALLDYLRAHANDLQGDMGAFLRRVIARHDARVEHLRSKVCIPTSTNNDWNEQNPQTAVISSSSQQLIITPIPQTTQTPQQPPIWGVTTSTSQVWSTSFSF